MTGSPHFIEYDPIELLKHYDPENKLERYYQLLFKENKRLNLVSRETGRARSMADGGFIILMKLAAQSLLPFEKLDLDAIENYLDIGSGGGFPAIPILLTKEVSQATLVERTQKKAGALRRILWALDLKADIISQSFEDLTFDPLFDLITLRQVKLTPRLFQKIYPRLHTNGVFIYYSTPDLAPSEVDIEKLTYHYSTGSNDPDGKFTIFRKRS